MAYVVVTALGREIPAQEWRAIRQDTILKALHDYGASPFNPGNEVLGLDVLGRATGLSAEYVLELCAELAARNLVELVGVGCRITEAGVAFVRDALSHAAFTGSLG